MYEGSDCSVQVLRTQFADNRKVCDSGHLHGIRSACRACATLVPSTMWQLHDGDMSIGVSWS